MDYISNFIVESPFLFLAFMLMLAVVLFISSMYFLFQKAKKEDKIQNAIRQKKLAELKTNEEYKAQFKSIHEIRGKFKKLKR